MKLQNFKIASALTAFTLLLVSSIGLPSQPAYAHKNCYKQSLGFPGSWTWVCKPHMHRPKEQSSCLAVVTHPTKYRIVNRTRNVVRYSLNGRPYRLNPQHRRIHKVGGGSSSCSRKSDRAEVTFDYNTQRPGYQRATRNLSRGGLSKNYEYYFSSRKNGAYLRLIPRDLRKPLVTGGRGSVTVKEPPKQQPKKTPPVESTKPVQPQPQPPEKEEVPPSYDWE